MKNHILDRLTRSGRLTRRLAEILADVEAQRIARMDAGDAIGRQIVAELEARGGRSHDETRLLFEAEVARARLYLASEGATPVEAAEAILRARDADLELGGERGEELIEPLRAILDSLLQIGSRRTAMTCWRVLEDLATRRPFGDVLRVDVVAMLDRMLRQTPCAAPAVEAVAVLVRLGEWPDVGHGASFAQMVGRLPGLLAEAAPELDAATVLEAVAFARRRELAIGADLERTLVLRLLEERRIDTEARLYYREAFERRGAALVKDVEAALSTAAAAPRCDDPFDADLEALNALVCEVLPEAHWPWENRAELYRRKDDAAAAVACLARVLADSGPPPRLLGLLAPLLVRMGFERSAREFCRFLDPRERKRLRLHVMDLIAAVPRSRQGERRLAFRLACCLDDPELPSELAFEARRRRAQLLLHTGDDHEARRQFERILTQRPEDAEAALGLIALDLGLGRLDDARRRLNGRFGPRFEPVLKLIRSRLAEAEGDLDAALELAVAGAGAIESARGAGREERLKSLAALGHRIERMHGTAMVDGALMAMLSMDAHAAPHPELETAARSLDRRCVRLGLALGRSDVAREAIARLRRRGWTVSDLLRPALEDALRNGRIEDAETCLDELESAGDAAREMDVYRAFLALKRGDADHAAELLTALLERGDARAAAPLAALHAAAGRIDDARRIVAAAPTDPGCLAVRAQLEEDHDPRAAVLTWGAAAADARIGAFARERSGLLAVAEGAKSKDRELLGRAVAALDGATGVAAQVACARARAALAPTPDAAARALEVQEKRLDHDLATPLRRDRLERLIEAGRFQDARRLGIELREEDPSDAELERLVGWIERRVRLDALLTLAPGDVAAFDAAAAALRALDGAGSDPVQTAIAGIVGRCGTGDDAIKGVRRDAPQALILAAALSGLTGRSPAAVERHLLRIAATPGPFAAVAQTLAALRGEDDGVDLAPVEDLARWRGLPSPIARRDLDRRVWVQALRGADAAEIDRLQAQHGAPPEDLAPWLELARIARSAGPRRIPDVLSVIARCLRSGPDELLEALRSRLLARSAELLESASPEWATARLRTAGKRTRSWLPAVLEVWRAARRPDGEGDGEAWLQTAQLALAAAHEGEIAGRGEAPWKEAHAHWNELLDREELWRSLARRHPEAAVRDVRTALPRDLLDAHFKRADALLIDGRHADAVRHVRIALESPLAARLGRPAVEERAFAVLARDFEAKVARKRYVEALEILDRVLVADPHNARARRETVRTAAEALRQSFAMIDVLTSAPECATLDEVATLSRPVLTYSDRAIDAFLDARTGRDLLDEDAVICLRARALVALREGGDASAAAAALDRALALLPASSPLERALRDLRATAGLEMICQALESADDGGAEALSDALRQLDALIAAAPEDERLVARKIEILKAAGRDGEAETLARELFEAARESGEPERARAAVEILHALQKDRGQGRLRTRLDLVDDLIRQRSWRQALQVFRDAVAGREDDPEHVCKHAEILIGLHKVRQAEERLLKLSSFGAFEARRRLLDARLSLLKHVAARGGDLYSAFELWERGEDARALALLADLAPADAEDVAARALVALCRLRSGGDCDAQMKRARRAAEGANVFWLPRLLDDEIKRHGATKES